MIVTDDIRAFQFVWPFVFAGVLFEAGSWIVLFIGPDATWERMAFHPGEFRDYIAGLYPRRGKAHI